MGHRGSNDLVDPRITINAWNGWCRHLATIPPATGHLPNLDCPGWTPKVVLTEGCRVSSTQPLILLNRSSSYGVMALRGLIGLRSVSRGGATSKSRYIYIHLVRFFPRTTPSNGDNGICIPSYSICDRSPTSMCPVHKNKNRMRAILQWPALHCTPANALSPFRRLPV